MPRDVTTLSQGNAAYTAFCWKTGRAHVYSTAGHLHLNLCQSAVLRYFTIIFPQVLEGQQVRGEAYQFDLPVCGCWVIVCIISPSASLMLFLCVSSGLDKCMPPAPPYQPQIVVVSDSEVALSWKAGVSEGSSPIQYYMVEFIRQVCQWSLNFSFCALQGFFFFFFN